MLPRTALDHGHTRSASAASRSAVARSSSGSRTCSSTDSRYPPASPGPMPGGPTQLKAGRAPGQRPCAAPTGWCGSGEWVNDEPTPHNVKVYGPAANHLHDSAGTGDPIIVHGLLRTESWPWRGSTRGPG